MAGVPRFADKKDSQELVLDGHCNSEAAAKAAVEEV